MSNVTRWFFSLEISILYKTFCVRTIQILSFSSGSLQTSIEKLRRAEDGGGVGEGSRASLREGEGGGRGLSIQETSSYRHDNSVYRRTHWNRISRDRLLHIFATAPRVVSLQANIWNFWHRFSLVWPCTEDNASRLIAIEQFPKYSNIARNFDFHFFIFMTYKKFRTRFIREYSRIISGSVRLITFCTSIITMHSIIIIDYCL